MNISVLKNSILIQSPLLQQSWNRHLRFSFKPGTPCLPISPFHVCVSIPMCELKFFVRTVTQRVILESRALLFTSSSKAWYSLAALGTYTCNRHIDWFSTLSFNMQTRDPRGTQSSIPSDNRGLVVSPHPLVQTNLDQLQNRRASTRHPGSPFPVRVRLFQLLNKQLVVVYPWVRDFISSTITLRCLHSPSNM